MKRLRLRRWKFRIYAAYLVSALVLGGGLLHVALAQAAGDISNTPAWSVPNAMALKRVSPISNSQHESNLLNNLDCSLADYRRPANDSLQTDCFTPTAFGLMSGDSSTVIFNGTDEGLPLLPYASQELLVPWPQTLDLAVLTPVNTGGSYLSLYKNPLAVLQNQRNALFELTAKRLIAPPDLDLKDPDGKPLVINAQTMAFSDGGSWLVAETLNGSFVRINLATLDVVAFAPSLGGQGSPALLKSQVAVSRDGRFVAIGNTAAAELQVYDLATCNGVVVGLRPQVCASFNYLPFVQHHITALQSVRHLRFINQDLLSFEAHTADPANDGVYELAPRDSILSLTGYLGLGDSYTSGEGAFDYLLGTDTSEDMCHVSARSYPLLLTHDIFGNAGGHSVACSGAVIDDVGSTSANYRGQVSGVANWDELQHNQSALLAAIMTNYSPGYVAQQRFLAQYQPAVTTVSVGGNDIGFGAILQKCVIPQVSLHVSANTCYNTYEDRLELTKLVDRTVPRWIALYRQLLAAAPGATIYAIGYPQVAIDTGNCALNVHLSKSELAFTEELVDYLNNDIRQAAVKAGVTYVDISQALVGHRLCETASYNVAVNGLTAGTDAGPLGIHVLGKESYHPNALGQALMEQTILRQTHSLTLVDSSTSTNNSAQTMLDVPKTGRTVTTLVPDTGLTTGLVRSGSRIPVQANGAQDGLKSQTVYSIRLDGADGTILGTTTSTPAGDISTTVMAPGTTASGEHSIDITGENQSGESVDVTQPVYVPVSDNDADGDGVPDTLDTCPEAINSGQDSDQDGIDDACDSLIGSQPSPGNPSSSGGAGGSGGSSGSSPGTGGGQVSTSDSSDMTPVATSGTRDSSTPTVAPVSRFASNQIPHSSQAISQSGKITQSPSKTVANTETAAKLTAPPGENTKMNWREPFSKLFVIDWVPWLILPIIAWLLVVLGWCVFRLADDKMRATQI